MEKQRIAGILVSVMLLGLLLVSVWAATGDTNIEKPRDATDNEGATTSPGLAFDYPDSYNVNTSANTTDFTGNASVTWYNWSTSDVVYANLSLTVTLSASSFQDDEWYVYVDNTTDGTCDDSDTLLASSASTSNPGITNFTMPLPRTQNLSLLETCLVGVQNTGPDGGLLRTYDIRTNGTRDTTPPEWRNQQQNSSAIVKDEHVELAAQAKDTVNLSHAVLATNETGTWQNKSVYGSPMQLYTGGAWTWSNFTWDNNSITAGTTVGWRIYYNDTAGNYNTTAVEAFDVKPPLLNVELVDPPSPLTAAQNETFTVNATVTCERGDCGEVNGTARYNSSSSEPDTAIPENSGEPFHTTTKSNPISCDTELLRGETCNVTWNVNATGSIGSTWLMDVNLTSNLSTVQWNDTADAEVEIFSSIVDINLQWDAIDFDTLYPGTTDNPAQNNSDDAYNITVTDSTTENVDLWVNGTDLQQEDGSDTIGVSNVSWNASVNDPSIMTPLTTTHQLLRSDVAPATNVTTYYWADVPRGIYADNYTGTLWVKANATGS